MIHNDIYIYTVYIYTIYIHTMYIYYIHIVCIYIYITIYIYIYIYGSFLKWLYPDSWMVCSGKSYQSGLFGDSGIPLF